MRLDLPILLDGLLDAFWPDGDAGALRLTGTMGHARLADLVADGAPTARAPWNATPRRLKRSCRRGSSFSLDEQVSCRRTLG